MFESKAPHKDWILKIINAFFPDAKVWLFGSYARGEQRETSDVDIAVDLGRPMEIREWGIIFNLCEALPISHKIDVVDMHMISDRMRDIILKEGIPWQT